MNRILLAIRNQLNQVCNRVFRLFVLVLSYSRYSYSIGIAPSSSSAISLSTNTSTTRWRWQGSKLIRVHMLGLVGLLAVGFLLLGSQSVAETPFNRLVWSDNFDGDEFDYSKWQCAINAFGGCNQELQLYTDRPENVRVENGSLVLEARKDKFGIVGTIRDYSSGRIRSRNRGDWKFGRFEVLARMPAGQALRPVIWLLPSKEIYGPWASNGVDFKGQKTDEIFGMIHFGSAWPKNKSKGTTYRLPAGNFADDFHKFSTEWIPQSITWYVDDIQFQRIDSWSSDAAPFPAPFDQPCHVVLNLAVGGHFVGPVLEDSKSFPAKLLIDYVRVYQ
jgi:beta-glucanase (GH16 family)